MKHVNFAEYLGHCKHKINMRLRRPGRY